MFLYVSWSGVIIVPENSIALFWARTNESKCPFGVFEISALGFGYVTHQA